MANQTRQIRPCPCYVRFTNLVLVCKRCAYGKFLCIIVGVVLHIGIEFIVGVRSVGECHWPSGEGIHDGGPHCLEGCRLGWHQQKDLNRESTETDSEGLCAAYTPSLCYQHAYAALSMRVICPLG